MLIDSESLLNSSHSGFACRVVVQLAAVHDLFPTAEMLTGNVTYIEPLCWAAYGSVQQGSSLPCPPFQSLLRGCALKSLQSAPHL